MNKYLLWLPGTLLVISSYGQDIPDVSLVRIADGQSVALTDCASCSGVVVIFTSPDCPFDRYYADRMRSLSETYSGRIKFFFIDPTLEIDGESPAVKSLTSSLPMYTDTRQQLIKILDVRKTPEAFLLRKKGTQLSLVYHGAIDDNAQMASSVTQPYLQTAIDKILLGQAPDQSEIRAGGCSIRKK